MNFMKQGNVFKLKKEKVDSWKEWAQFLNDHASKVIPTLRQENILYEGSLLFQLDEDWYVCLFALKNNNEDSISSADLTNELNVRHREKMKECFKERVTEVSVPYFFSSK